MGCQRKCNSPVPHNPAPGPMFGFMTLIIYRYIIRKLNLWNSDNGLK